MNNQEVFDWAEHEHDSPRLGPRSAVNPVTKHALDCRCSRCPMWYVDRAELAAGGVAAAPEQRKTNVLTDQVVPVSVLMLVFTACMVVLLPVVAPLVALAAVSVVAVVTSVVALAVAALVLLAAFTRTRGDIGPAPASSVIRGRILRRR